MEERSIEAAAIRHRPNPTAGPAPNHAASGLDDEATLNFTGTPIVRVDTGEFVRLEDRILVGRVPSASELGLTGAAELALDDPSGLVSRNHALIVLDGSVVRVFDLHSTNGTVVVRDGVEYAVRGDADELLGVNDRIEIGLRTLSLEFL